MDDLYGSNNSGSSPDVSNLNTDPVESGWQVPVVTEQVTGSGASTQGTMGGGNTEGEECGDLETFS